MLGLRFLSMFEVEIDPEAQAVAFHPLGHVECGRRGDSAAFPL